MATWLYREDDGKETKSLYDAHRVSGLLSAGYTLLSKEETKAEKAKVKKAKAKSED